MKRRLSALLVPAVLLIPAGLLLATAAAPSHKLGRAKTLPKGTAPKIAAQLNAAGFQIAGPKGPVCTIWLVKDIPIRDKFKPSLSVKYPFMPGQLVGLLQVQDKTGYTDFRGQEMKPGVYTLRYGQQPEDGNHVGTSDLADFLLGIPAAKDTDPKPISGFDDLAQKSAGASGSTHPAIFSMLPAEKPIKAATISHDKDHDFWILNVSTPAKAKTRSTKLSLRFIAIGRTSE